MGNNGPIITFHELPELGDDSMRRRKQVTSKDAMNFKYNAEVNESQVGDPGKWVILTHLLRVHWQTQHYPDR